MSLIEILSFADCIQGRIEIVICGVYVSAEIAYPFHTVIDKSHKWVDIGSAIFAPDNRFLSISN
jgi:hypothetical protein